jgi:hypothetical protein
MDHFGISTLGAFTLNEELASLWPKPEPPDEDEAPQEDGAATGDSDAETKTAHLLHPSDFATMLRDFWPLLCISIRSKTFFRETFYSPKFDPLRKRPSVMDVTVLCGPWTNTRSLDCAGDSLCESPAPLGMTLQNGWRV